MVVSENQQLLIPVVWSSLVAAQGSMLSTGGILAFVVSSFGGALWEVISHTCLLLLSHIQAHPSVKLSKLQIITQTHVFGVVRRQCR